MTKKDFEDDSFDGLTAFYSIIHVPRKKLFFLVKSFHRLLKGQGVMMICMGSDKWKGTAEYSDTKMFWSHYSSEKSLQLVKDAEFQIVSGKYLARGARP